MISLNYDTDTTVCIYNHLTCLIADTTACRYRFHFVLHKYGVQCPSDTPGWLWCKCNLETFVIFHFGAYFEKLWLIWKYNFYLFLSAGSSCKSARSIARRTVAWGVSITLIKKIEISQWKSYMLAGKYMYVLTELPKYWMIWGNVRLWTWTMWHKYKMFRSAVYTACNLAILTFNISLNVEAAIVWSPCLWRSVAPRYTGQGWMLSDSF